MAEFSIYMEPTNKGSFGAGVLGDTSALRAAMDAKGIDSSVLEQVSNAAPTGGTNISPPLPQGDPNVGVPQQAVQPPKEPDSDVKIALKALGAFVTSEGKVKEIVAKGQTGGF